MPTTKINSPKSILSLVRKERISKKNYHIIIFLDKEKSIISIHKKILSNNRDETKIDLKDIFIPAFYLAAKNIIIVKILNKKTITVKNFDTQFAMKLKNSGKILDIIFVDYLLINQKNYYSFHESGKL